MADNLSSCNLGRAESHCGAVHDSLFTCAPLKVAVGNSEDVRVRRFWVLVKGGFQIAKPATDVYLTLSTNSALISEDDKTMPAKM